MGGEEQTNTKSWLEATGQSSTLKKQAGKLHYKEINHIWIGCLHLTEATRRTTAPKRKCQSTSVQGIWRTRAKKRQHGAKDLLLFLESVSPASAISRPAHPWRETCQTPTVWSREAAALALERCIRPEALPVFGGSTPMGKPGGNDKALCWLTRSRKVKCGHASGCSMAKASLQLRWEPAPATEAKAKSSTEPKPLPFADQKMEHEYHCFENIFSS